MSASPPVKCPKKLIEVALPLDAINEAAIRENYIYKGNPSAIHKWWAQRPLAVARAVIFAQLVNDPGFQQGGGFRFGKNKKEAAEERKRLFKLIEDLVKWENTANEEVLEAARTEIRRSWREVCDLNKDYAQAAELFNPNKIPGLHDPFAGGGTIPLEAQRLGLEAFASDLNPVAVVINKALVEIPPKFAGRLPVHPDTLRNASLTTWQGAEGLAEDIRCYGAWMRKEAQRRIGHLYPPVEITAAMARERPDLKLLVGQKLTVIAWLWARTVKSPNPAFSHVEVPLASTFILSAKKGKEVYVEPVVKGDRYQFRVKLGKPPLTAKNGTKLSRGANFSCIVSGAAIEPKYIYAEANAKRMGTCLMAAVVEGSTGRIYLNPTSEMEAVAKEAKPNWQPEVSMPENPRWFSPPLYGLKTYGDLFTPRQLVALTTFSDLVIESRQIIRQDAIGAGMADDKKSLDAGGTGATAYAEAVSIYLAFALSKTTEYSSSLTVWYAQEDRPKGLFARQAIPMVWDFPEQNVLGDIGGSFLKSSKIVADSLSSVASIRPGVVYQADAASNDSTAIRQTFVSTDPPYYDNIGYADLSDFFYVWLRRSLNETDLP